MPLNHNIRQLQANEIAGQGTINPMQQFMLGMNSLSDFLTIEANGKGSVNFDFDAKQLIKIILDMVSTNEALQCSFRGSVDGNTLTVSSGKVYFPDTVVSVSGGTFSTGQTVHIALTGSTSSISGTLATGNVGNRIITSATTMLLPLMTTTTIGGKTYPFYYHVGDYVFDWRPATWISGFDSTKTQSLDHIAGSNDVIWNTYEECDEE